MGVIQGLDTIPSEIQKLLRAEFSDFLSGRSGYGEYNFRSDATALKTTEFGLGE